MLIRLPAFALIATLALTAAPASSASGPLRVAIAGLVHGHVEGFLNGVKARNDVQVIAIFDPDRALQHKYAQRFGFREDQCFSSLNDMLDRTRPEAVAAFTSTSDHLMVLEAAAHRHIPMMMEKPLAVSTTQAREMQRVADSAGIAVIVNYETTWYRSHAEIRRLFKDQHAAGDIRKMVAMDGHSGPKEIGVGPEFLGWLTDPVKNGAGALFDFGCYGANLMTWMMDNQRPISVSAVTQTFKPGIYSRIDDEANVLLEYPNAVGIIQGSWNWPFSRKDFEVYGQHGYAIAVGGNTLRTRVGGAKDESTSAPPALAPDETDSVAYLSAVVRGRLKPAGLSSLENNVIVVEILEAARESARTGKKVKLR